MNKEQNINDILKLLKDSVSTQQITAEDIGVEKSSDFSDETLKKQLKDAFLDSSDHVSNDNTSESDYVIDKSFLEDAVNYHNKEEDIQNEIKNEETFVTESQTLIHQEAPNSVSDAVDQPAVMAFSMSGIPGPWSEIFTITFSGVISTSAAPPPA